MRLSTYGYTNQGGRDHNEDSIAVHRLDSRDFLVLADGLGGHDCGEVASQMAVDSISETLSTCKSVSSKVLHQGILTANDAILAQHQEMKTTVTALVLEKKKAIFGYVGDSRIYHFRNGGIVHVTADHSVTYRKYKGGEISYKDVYTDEDRSSLLRALGKENTKPECGEWDVRIGDAFLLCSDGFWEKVYDLEMLVDLQKSMTPEQWAQSMLKRHIRTIDEKSDNFSVICAFVEE